MPAAHKTTKNISMATISEINAATVPKRDLLQLHMVNDIPMIALQCEPRVKYTMHIPERHYPEPPPACASKLPVLVVMHGGKADAIKTKSAWIAFAEDMGIAVLAPLFPVGSIENDPWDVDAYRFLGRKPIRLRDSLEQQTRSTLSTGRRTMLHDQLLLAMLDEISARWPGLDTSKIFLTGFSAGSQFSHRFLYAHPERLLGVGVGAPGFVTLLDQGTRWPFGVADFESQFGRPLDIEAILRVPVLLVTGAEDTDQMTYIIRDKVHGPLPGMAVCDVKVRTDNVKLHGDSLRSHGAEAVEEGFVAGIEHEMLKVQPAVARWLAPLVRKRQAELGGA